MYAMNYQRALLHKRRTVQRSSKGGSIRRGHSSFYVKFTKKKKRIYGVYLPSLNRRSKSKIDIIFWRKPPF